MDVFLMYSWPIGRHSEGICRQSGILRSTTAEDFRCILQSFVVQPGIESICGRSLWDVEAFSVGLCTLALNEGLPYHLDVARGSEDRS